MLLETEFETSEGLTHCKIARVDCGSIASFSVDVWRSGQYMEDIYEEFAGTVLMQWDGKQYCIFRAGQDVFASSYWREMEILISNTIMTNE